MLAGETPCCEGFYSGEDATHWSEIPLGMGFGVKSLLGWNSLVGGRLLNVIFGKRLGKSRNLNQTCVESLLRCPLDEGVGSLARGLRPGW